MDRLWEAIVVMTFVDLLIAESALINHPLTFPYVTGLLSFRKRQRRLSCLIGCRRVRICCWWMVRGWLIRAVSAWPATWGVLADVLTIRVAKLRLIGTRN